jgi:hypothetical protein
MYEYFEYSIRLFFMVNHKHLAANSDNFDSSMILELASGPEAEKSLLRAFVVKRQIRPHGQDDEDGRRFHSITRHASSA